MVKYADKPFKIITDYEWPGEWADYGKRKYGFQKKGLEIGPFSLYRLSFSNHTISCFG